MNRRDLEERLIDFAVNIIQFSRRFPSSGEGNYFAGQMVRSGSSTALNYGESVDAESTKDYVHKIKIVVKELRETHIALRIVLKSEISKDVKENKELISETNELISIFVATLKSIRTNNNMK